MFHKNCSLGDLCILYNTYLLYSAELFLPGFVTWYTKYHGDKKYSGGNRVNVSDFHSPRLECQGQENSDLTQICPTVQIARFHGLFLEQNKRELLSKHATLGTLHNLHWISKEEGRLEYDLSVDSLMHTLRIHKAI